MREIATKKITDAVSQLCIEANYYLPDDVIEALKKAKEKEVSPVGRAVLDEIFENLRIAREEKLPICQDCGTSVFLIELGQDVHITEGSFYDAINDGVRKGYKEGYLRKSMTYDPVLTRANTGDNTPAVIHTDIVPGDKIKICFCPKGGGCENMSTLKMMSPAEGMEEVKKFVVDSVQEASGNPCPPSIIGVGIGGTFEKAAFLAKKAVLRSPLGTPHPDERYAKVEQELLEEINRLGIGPMGFGGRITALAVHIETHPAHVALMPVAVNINCHAARQKTVII
ncbi:MAG: fumarate hydratase [Candidatus Thermoplasmatota archaeon]|nr:fumarate hydratase [Candidatus Thermoplasmatota archaeon]